MFLMIRDAPPEHSTVPFDMEPEILPEGSPVPVNETSIKQLFIFLSFHQCLSLMFSCETESPTLVALLGADAGLHPWIRAD